MNTLYLVAIMVIGVCALCFYFMAAEIGRLNTEIKLIRHELNLDKRDYKRLLEIEGLNDSKNL